MYIPDVLESHRQWVESDGKSGERAELRNALLQQADFHDANLERADLNGASLSVADLMRANLAGRYHERRPLPVSLGVLDTYHGPWNSVWIIDGELNPKMGGRGPFINASPVTAARATAKPYSAGAQTMEDMPARLADLDKYNIDYQVVMPSVFLYSLTDDPDFNRAQGPRMYDLPQPVGRGPSTAPQRMPNPTHSRAPSGRLRDRRHPSRKRGRRRSRR